MATINATISVSSDIMSYPISINKTMTMKITPEPMEMTPMLNKKKKKLKRPNNSEEKDLGNKRILKII